MQKHQITDGVYYLEIPEANLRILCGSPMDIVKNLMRGGYIQLINELAELETGPNAILLSDISVQNGAFCNLTEFPIMHMFYKQGMLIPQTENYGEKPLIIGIPEQIRSQIDYLERGFNGLSEKELSSEMTLSPEHRRELLALKKKFKYNSPLSVDKLIEFRSIESNEKPFSLRGEVSVVRLGLNVYLFQCGEEEEIIDLTLTEQQKYGVPYNLDFHPVNRRDFAIIHSGEGNGWDKNRPAMGSIICAKGRYYLIDAGPNIIESLEKLGISLSEVDGLFQTHAHDDHFSGLTSIIRSERRIKFFSLPIVRHSVMRKLAALMQFDLTLFNKFFDVCDLTVDQWNAVDGFEVLPSLSPHPVETNIFYFRMQTTDGGWRSYAHLADTISRRVYQSFIEQNDDDCELLKQCYERTWSSYMRPVNVKKIDVNGGLIHGEADDYADDRSGKIVFSHTSGDLTDWQRELGCNATFGSEELLIPASEDYLEQSAYHYLDNYFPEVSRYEKLKIVRNQRILINSGTIILPKDKKIEYVYLTLSGIVEHIDVGSGIKQRLEAGTILGEVAAMSTEPTLGAYRALSYVKALRIPVKTYQEFIYKNVDLSQYNQTLHLCNLLQESQLFKQITSRPLMADIARHIEYKDYKENEILNEGANNSVGIILEGMAGIFYKDTLVETLSTGSYYGEESFLNISDLTPTVVALAPLRTLSLSLEIFFKIPVLLWSLIESSDKITKLIAQTARLMENPEENDAMF
jgi:hemerythrin